MKLKIDLKKGTEAVSEALQKTSEISKKLSDTVQEKAKDLSEKNKNENYLKRLRLAILLKVQLRTLQISVHSSILAE